MTAYTAPTLAPDISPAHNHSFFRVSEFLKRGSTINTNLDHLIHKALGKLELNSALKWKMGLLSDSHNKSMTPFSQVV